MQERQTYTANCIDVKSSVACIRAGLVHDCESCVKARGRYIEEDLRQTGLALGGVIFMQSVTVHNLTQALPELCVGLRWAIMAVNTATCRLYQGLQAKSHRFAEHITFALATGGHKAGVHVVACMTPCANLSASIGRRAKCGDLQSFPSSEVDILDEGEPEWSLDILV